MMKKFITATLVALLSVVNVWAQKSVVWESPTTESGIYGDGFFNTSIDVTKVELSKAETKVFLHISLRSDYADDDCKFRFAKDTYLEANGEKYPIVSAEGMPLGEFIQTGKDGKLDVVFHFKPLPMKTKKFDLKEGEFNGAYNILGITSIEERYEKLFPSYWRNENGDWKIAFLDDCVIYENGFWRYKMPALNPSVKGSELSFTIRNDEGKELTVNIGKNKKGTRVIKIGDKAETYSMITSRFMPDYPVKDTRTDFVDTNYKTDSVTVIGWIKDMPAYFKEQKTFGISYEDFFFDKESDYLAQLDDQGRFTIKFPLVNTAEFFNDWRRCFIRTVFEPGKTYFMLYDFKEGRRYFMGDDVRLQNEMFKFPVGWVRVGRMERGDDADKFLAEVDSTLKVQYKELDELCKEHPTLSTRFIKMWKGNVMAQQAREVGQSRFALPDFHFTKEIADYSYENFWKKRETPYPLHRDIRGFMRDYVADAASKHSSNVKVFIWKDHFEEFADKDELALLRKWAKWQEDVAAKINAEPDTVKKKQMVDAENKANEKMIKDVEAILMAPKAQSIARDFFLDAEVNTLLNALDSLGAEQLIKDVFVAEKYYDEIDHDRKSISQDRIDKMKSIVKNPDIIERVVKANNNYLALENQELDKSMLRSNDEFKDISEGQALLEKIIEPYKGKVILMDIWGTWCGPCKEALSHSQEEYERLKPYDLVYIYLANRSPQESWENIIKEYHVQGENVVHFNLPREQQEAIENYLQVNAFPTYVLFNKYGNQLEVNADPRDLNGLEGLLKRLTGK